MEMSLGVFAVLFEVLKSQDYDADDDDGGGEVQRCWPRLL